MNELESIADQLSDIVMQKEALDEKIYQVSLIKQLCCGKWHEHVKDSLKSLIYLTVECRDCSM